MTTKPSISLVPTVSVKLMREGKPYRPAIGQAAMFTAAERDELNTIHPGALREPRNESATHQPAQGGADGGTGDKAPGASNRTEQGKSEGGKSEGGAADDDDDL